ncbi:Gamma-glutamylcysteine synthetase [Desulfonispora thiosulfatigenes DSM 11270]|uniref:glutamate--cysteine ligase n=1 Tax=Desulfonispora thiosulfatigenes DSM 11270 TaxID=656914 RepID=A0A1W1VH66_DESTI|nr:glutamate-cysteine ligase family protein [Desulfonispora thiosulfatigenes]SMB92401.1 Gamma-glutamylcysteine synthetase [Desulfonispora thiosulfatigenes DSM 11270]
MVEKFVEYFNNNEYTGEEFLMNVAFEHFIVKKDTFDRVAPEGDKGVKEVLKELAEKGWKSLNEVSLEKDNLEVTLGKGNQLKFAVHDFSSLHDLNNEYMKFLDEVFPILEKQGNMLLAVGYHPNSKGENVQSSTASIEISINYANKLDFRKKIQVAYGLQPLLTAMFDNSPIYEGEVYERFSLREKIYEDFVKNGVNILDRNYEYENYANDLINLATKLGVEASDIDFNNNEINSQITVDNKINLKLVDAIPYPLNMAYVAMVKGLIFDHDNLEALFEFVNALTPECLQQVKKDVLTQSLDAKFGDGSLRDLGKDVIFMANTKLPLDEKKYLKTIDTILYKEVIPKQVTLKQLNK